MFQETCKGSEDLGCSDCYVRLLGTHHLVPPDPRHSEAGSAPPPHGDLGKGRWGLSQEDCFNPFVPLSSAVLGAGPGVSCLELGVSDKVEPQSTQKLL